MVSRISSFLKLYCTRNMAVMVLLGFSSGLPLPLTSGTLQAWLTVAGVDIRTIGIFSLVGIPYTAKFIWSPLMDRFVPPWLGRRRGWAVSTQIVLMAGISWMAFSSPQYEPLALAVLALMVAFASASQDIVVDAYRTDVLSEQERGTGSATFIVGYRVAMLTAGAIALIMSDRIGWQNTYLIMAGLLMVGMAGTLLGQEPDGKTVPPRNFKEAVWGPLKDFFYRPMALVIVLFIILYKLGDAYAGSMTTTFLLRGVGFTATDVGTINKGLGFAATIIGALYGGGMLMRLGLFRSLMIFGVLQMVSNLSFMALVWTGKSYPMLIFAVGFENIAGGMGMAAFMAFIMTVCNKRYSATQFALLSSLSALGRVFISPSSGYVVNYLGWAPFFFITTVTALPGLLMLWWLKDEMDRLAKGQA
jgi:MFS transporter, PAT family, beta-lactamase induction signal transducer AmpG